MIFSATLSKPTPQVQKILRKKFERVRIRLLPSAESSTPEYYAEFFTGTQSFQKKFSEKELNDFLSANIGKTFKNCVQRTETEEITFLTNKKGKTTRLAKQIAPAVSERHAVFGAAHSSNLPNPFRKKKYILQEGTPIPFLVELGVMTKEGKVVAAKYDKFRQINRFLEFLNDVLPDVLPNEAESGQAEQTKKPLRIIDFGSGKSYLTFAVHYYLTQIKKIPCDILGLDLKKEVIENCTALCKRLGLGGLEFKCGDIASYNGAPPDIVITLHACDTATDYALNFAINSGARIILSVPCCQHEINLQLHKNNSAKENAVLAPLLKYGIVRERFAALVTDCVRAEILESSGYSTQLLEFIDMEGTPKNLLIRAVKKYDRKNGALAKQKILSYNALLNELEVSQKLDCLQNNTQAEKNDR